ncbi:MAG: RNA polymerase sigma factor [Solirubrobacteraceae bacterium]
MTRGHTRLLATQPDERLLELVQRGHERAFEAIVLRYRRPLLAYCRRLGLSDSRAEDVLQQALLKAWLALRAGVEVRALSPWLYRIVHNTAINVMRSSREELALEPDGALVERLVVPGSELENAGAARQALTHVAALPSMQRDAMLLSAVDGRSHEEVARELGITSGAVRGLLYRARSALRAAAAALTPGSLISWASGTTGRASPTASRLAELTGAAGGADVGGVLLKGAAVAGSALLAAGVVLAPLHGRAAQARRHLALPAASASAGADVVPPDGGHASTPSASGLARTRAANGARPGLPATHAGTPLGGSVVAPTTVHTGPTPAVTVPAAPGAAGQTPLTSTSAAPAAAAATSPTATGSEAAAGGGAGGSAGGSGGGSGSGSGGGSGNGSGGGSGSGSETEGRHSETSGDDGSEGTDGGQGDDSGGSDQAEHEREAASERAEREAEVAHEHAEREAEVAHEHEHDGGKDS